jgi:hypothetical protein
MILLLTLVTDKGLQLYKTSNVSQLGTLSGKDLSGEELNETRREISVRQSWEDDSLIREGACSFYICLELTKYRIANSSLPTVRHAVRNERFARENNDDRMNLWIHNVESMLATLVKSFSTDNCHNY